jgi:galactokinase
MAIGRAWLALAEVEMSPSDLAKIGQRCENGFVGVQSGIMDQMASAHGRAGFAMFLDTRDLTLEYAPIPKAWRILLLETGKARALTKSGYNERRSACEWVAAQLGKSSLRDVSFEELMHRWDHLGDRAIRAKHVVTENDRAQRFATALRAEDAETAGRLMRESHKSLRDDYEVSCEELDVMAECAWEEPGCIGARLTGAGFGGACVALCHENAVEEVAATVVRQYDARIGAERGLTAAALICEPSDGARVTHYGDNQ